MPRPQPPLRGKSTGSLFANNEGRDPSASSPRADLSRNRKHSISVTGAANASPSSKPSSPPLVLERPDTDKDQRPSIKNLFRVISNPHVSPRGAHVTRLASTASLTAGQPRENAIAASSQLSPVADGRVTRERERARSPIGRIERGRRTRAGRGIDNEDEPYDLMRLVSPTTAAPRSRTTSPVPKPGASSSSAVPPLQRKGPRPFSPPPPGMAIPYARSPSVRRPVESGASNLMPQTKSHFGYHHRSSSTSTNVSMSGSLSPAAGNNSSGGMPSFERPASPSSTHPRPLSSPSLRTEGRHVSHGSDSYSIRDYLAESKRKR